MEEPTYITLCLICESQVSPTNDGNDTDTRASISILKKILIQQNEADVKLEKGNSEAIRLFCPSCTEILYEWHEIQGLMSNLLVRSKTIKNRLIVNILQSNVTLSGQLQDSAALQELLEDFAAVKRAVINEYRPSLQLERLAEIPFDTLRNCFGNSVQNEEPGDLLDNFSGFEHEDYHDDWEAPAFDAAEKIEFQYDGDDGSDQMNRKSSSISRHVMTTRKRKRSPTEQCDGRNPNEKHIQGTDDTSRRTRRKPGNQTPGTDVLQETRKPKADEKRKKRSVVVLPNGDILYDGKYAVKFSDNKYLCPLCERKRTGKYSIIEHIREDHIRAKADEKRKQRSVVELPNGDILYDGKYTMKLSGNKYLCPLCALQRSKKHAMTEHILEDHIRGKGSNEITSVGENTFLYLNQYGFTFSKNRFKCTACGVTENKRHFLIDHIQVSHVNGADQAKDVSMFHPESSDSEEETEEDSDAEQEEPVTEGINNPQSGPRNRFRFVEIAENVFLYAGKYRIVLKNGRYKCPKCSTKRRNKFGIMEHMREKHMKCVVSQKVRPFNRIVAINENEFLYGGKYRMTRIQNRYFCSQCPMSRSKIETLTDHIRVAHIWKEDQTTDVSKATGQPKAPSSSLVDEEDVGEAETVENAERDPDLHHSESVGGEVEPETLHTETENETSQANVLQETLIPETEKAGRQKSTVRSVVELDNGDILYDGKYTVKWCGNKYLCPLCGLQRKGKRIMIGHIREDHIRGKGTNEIIGVGENTFLYLNQYGFTFSKNRYKCTTCGITLASRLHLTNHIQAYHINGGEKTKSMGVSKKVKGQAKAPSSSLAESEDVSEPEGEENNEEDPDWHHPESSDSEVENETLQTETDNQTSEGDVLQEALDQADKPRRKKRSMVTLDNGDILYNGKYTIRLYGKKYLCPLCALQRSQKHAMTMHILGDHIRGKGSNEIASLGENTFLYLNQYGFTFSDNHYKCTTCGIAVARRSYLIDHIQVCHVNGVEPLAPETSTIEGRQCEDNQLLPEVSETCTIETSKPEDTQLPPEVSETCTIETSLPEFAQLPPEVSETCTVETSQPEGTQVPLHIQPFDATETINAIQSMKCEAVKSEAVHIEPENQPSGNNVQLKTFNVESHDETDENKRIKRTVVVLENGDVLYDGKYTIKLYGKKYLCPLCGLQRNGKYGITEHIRVDHILAKPPTTPEITAVGENSFLYLNQYGFSCTNNNWYECTTCGITLSLRHILFNHIQVSHVNGTDKAILVGKGQGQPKAQSSFVEDANESESVENTEEDPDWHQTDSSDSEVQNEKDSDDEEEESVARDTNNPPISPRKPFKFIPITKNVFLYADKYRIVLKGGLYKCPKCSCMMKHKFAVMQHIRKKHMKRVELQKVQPFNKLVTISENEFLYGGKYRLTKVKNRYFCSECPTSRSTVSALTEHVRRIHIRKKDAEVPEATPETEGQSNNPNTGSHKLTKIGPNEYLYGGQVRISVNDGVYKCGSCGAEIKTLTRMRHHAARIHIRCATDEFYKSVQTLQDGTFKCGLCEFVGKKWDSLTEHIKCHKNSLKNTGSTELRKYNFSVEVSPNHFDHGGWPYRFVTETGRYNCGSCNFTFRTRPKVVRHIGLYHKNPVEQAVCDECGKTFANKDLLRSHKPRHRPKTVPCPECDKLFVNQDDLKGHMKTHLGEAAKTQVCEFCGKGFYKLNQLEKHRATHTGEAPYSCDDCGLGYYTQRELKNHQKTKHPKKTGTSNVPSVDTNDAVVSIEIVDGVITDISSM